MVDLLLVFEVAIPVSYLGISQHLSVPLLVLVPKEADHFHEHNYQEEKDGPRNQNHDNTMGYVAILQVKARGHGVFDAFLHLSATFLTIAAVVR